MILKLSFQTWYIHCLSVIDWLIFIDIFWKYAYQIKSKTLMYLTSALVLFFLSAICILTWHYFSNVYLLKWLIGLQSILTIVGNFSLVIATWRRNDRI
uniref:hypothetical protein Ycf49 n=1 Tax=Neustupella aerophytica TaxID=2962111 RepID=UPI002182181C|nr:hypothetical protein Ycf49 [Neustupella aerophytica]UVI61174.1 hypothetical protein Ycf49 [Neustupella aerophytica]